MAMQPNAGFVIEIVFSNCPLKKFVSNLSLTISHICHWHRNSFKFVTKHCPCNFKDTNLSQLFEVHCVRYTNIVLRVRHLPFQPTRPLPVSTLGSSGLGNLGSGLWGPWAFGRWASRPLDPGLLRSTVLLGPTWPMLGYWRQSGRQICLLPESTLKSGR